MDKFSQLPGSKNTKSKKSWVKALMVSSTELSILRLVKVSPSKRLGSKRRMMVSQVQPSEKSHS